MIEYDNFIYLDVYRTGSSHVVDLLGKICEGKPIHAVRHASLTRCRPWGTTGGKVVFTAVRNPWDWYVSLWAIGADGKRPIRKPMLEHKAQADVDALYDRSDPKAGFSRWLNVMHDPAELNRFLMKEHLPQSVICEPCVGTKDTACVDVCPVDCIHPRKDEPEFQTAEMLYIHPDECIDCGACVPACPVEAIFALDETPEKWKNFIPVNSKYFQK